MRHAADHAPWVLIQPQRLEPWLARFRDEHGEPGLTTSAGGALLAAPDGVVADLRLPFPPANHRADAPYAALVDHVVRQREVGVLLVRLGGFAAGVFSGTRLVSSKVGSRPVHGRNAAGGWSQQRFARRREREVNVALSAAADAAVAVLAPLARTLDAVVVGGDRRAIRTVLADPRLRDVAALVTEPHLDVPDPRLRVLQQAPRTFLAARVRILGPDRPPAP